MRKGLQCRGPGWLHDRVKVSHLAGNMQRGNLPVALGVLIEACDNATGYEAGMIHALVWLNEIPVRLNMLASPR